MSKQLPEITTRYLSLLQSRLENASKQSIEARAYLKALHAQILFSEKELHVSPEELIDPLGAKNFHVTERLIHQYKNRVLLLSTGHCFAYCRFCFRKNFTGKNEAWISDDEIQRVCEYLASHSEVKEILISGGDPLLATNEMLFSLLESIRNASPKILIRLGTRSLLFAPSRFTNETIERLKTFFPLWLIPHINHPLEISSEYAPEVLEGIEKIRCAGIPMQSQTVLLKGVNDSVEILTDLFHNLVSLGIKPGYLFQLDLAKGTSHFRLPLLESLSLFSALKKELSGLSCPVFAVDLPGGAGKLNLEALRQIEEGFSFEKKELKMRILKPNDNTAWYYPLN